MNECIPLATLLGYAAAVLLGLLVLGLLAALIYLARRLRISIGLADVDTKARAQAGEGNLAVAGAAPAVRKKGRPRQAAQARHWASRLEVLVGILLMVVGAVAVGLLIGIVI